MNLEGMKVGDRLTINVGREQPYQFRTVARVLANGIVDDKGDRWTLRGYKHGTGGPGAYYLRTHVQKFESRHEQINKEIEQTIRERRKREQVRDINWRELPMDRVNAILAILHRRQGGVIDNG